MPAKELVGVQKNNGESIMQKYFSAIAFGVICGIGAGDYLAPMLGLARVGTMGVAGLVGGLLGWVLYDIPAVIAALRRAAIELPPKVTKEFLEFGREFSKLAIELGTALMPWIINIAGVVLVNYLMLKYAYTHKDLAGIALLSSLLSFVGVLASVGPWLSYNMPLSDALDKALGKRYAAIVVINPVGVAFFAAMWGLWFAFGTLVAVYNAIRWTFLMLGGFCLGVAAASLLVAALIVELPTIVRELFAIAKRAVLYLHSDVRVACGAHASLGALAGTHYNHSYAIGIFVGVGTGALTYLLVRRMVVRQAR